MPQSLPKPQLDSIFIEHDPLKPRPNRKRKSRTSNERHNASEQKRREKINGYILKLSNFVGCRKKSTLSILNSTHDFIKKLQKEIEENEAMFNQLKEENEILNAKVRDIQELKT